MYGNVIYWKSRKQNSVTKASTFAEYVALSECVSELNVITNIILDFNIETCKLIDVYKDNSGTIAIAKFGNFTKNSKHVETHYHFVSENYLNRLIDIVKMNPEDN